MKQWILYPMIFAGLALSGCTKKRPTILPKELSENIFDLNLFKQTQYQIQTGSPKKTERGGSNSLCRPYSEEQQQVYVLPEKSKISEKLRFMLRGELAIEGTPNTTYPLVFTVDSENVKAYKVVPKGTKLSTMETSLSSKSSKNGDSRIYIPIFSYDVLRFGTLERTENDLQEQTPILRLKTSDFSSATHIEIAPTSDRRKKVQITTQWEEERERTFKIQQLQNRETTVGELSKQCKITIGDFTPETPIVTRVDSEGVRIFEMVSTAKLSNEQKQLLESGRGIGEVERCPGKNDCALIARIRIPGRFAEIKSVRSRQEIETSDLAFRPTTFAKSQTQDGLIQIEAGILPERLIVDGAFNPESMLELREFENREFFLRRTIYEAPAAFSLWRMMSGEIQLVRFLFEDKEVLVMSQLQNGEAPETVDARKGIVMKFAANYYQIRTTDAAGAKLTRPIRLKSDRKNAQFVEINWTENLVHDVGSPLLYDPIGSCLSKPTSRLVAKMQNRLKEGYLSFDMIHDISIGDQRCSSESQPLHQGALLQTTGRMVERISFKENDRSLEISPAPNLPLRAQKTLGMGFFTYGRLDRSNYKSGLSEGEERVFPKIFDFRNQKVLTYYLANITTAHPHYKAIKGAATKAVQDWNRSLHNAFAGSPLERKGEYIRLLDAPPEAKLGDLDRNLIWIEHEPASGGNGALGFMSDGIHPRSGLVVSSNVVLYTGTLLASIQMNRLYLEAIQLENQKRKNALNARMEEEHPDNFKGRKLEASDTNIGENTGSIKDNVLDALKSWKPDGGPAGDLSPGDEPGVGSGDTSRKQDRIQQLRRSPWLAAIDGYVTGLENGGPLVAEKNLAYHFSHIHKLTEKPELNQKFTSLSMSEAQRRATIQSLSSKGLCFLDGGSSAYHMDAEDEESLKMDVLELFENQVTKTISHEIGHALGLRHNFQGSFDKRNFNLAEERESDGTRGKRKYSSVMDYFTYQYFTHTDPGPQDIYALRAMYTGYVEIEDEVAAGQETGPNGAKVLKLGVGEQNGYSISLKPHREKYISLNDLRKLIGVDSNWSNLTPTKLGKFMPRHYYFCSDEEEGQMPTCNRHDSGTTPLEVAEFQIQRTKLDIYFFSQKLFRRSFTYISKFFWYQDALERFIKLRSFLPELIVTVTNRKNLAEGSKNSSTFSEDMRFNELVDGYLTATRKIYEFLLSVLKTPTSENSDDFFKIVDLKKETSLSPEQVKFMKKLGENRFPEFVIAEVRPTYDVFSETGVESNDFREIETAGILPFKIGALYQLMNPKIMTSRQRRFNQENSSIAELSFVDFETLLDSKRPAKESPILNIVSNLILFNMPPAVYVPKLGLVDISSRTQDIYLEVAPEIAFSAAESGLVIQKRSRNDWRTDNVAQFRVVSNMYDPAPVFPKDFRSLPVATDLHTIPGRQTQIWPEYPDSIIATPIRFMEKTKLLFENYEKIKPTLESIVEERKARDTRAYGYKDVDSGTTSQAMKDLAESNRKSDVLLLANSILKTNSYSNPEQNIAAQENDSQIPQYSTYEALPLQVRQDTEKAYDAFIRFLDIESHLSAGVDGQSEGNSEQKAQMKTSLKIWKRRFVQTYHVSPVNAVTYRYLLERWNSEKAKREFGDIADIVDSRFNKMFQILDLMARISPNVR